MGRHPYLPAKEQEEILQEFRLFPLLPLPEIDTFNTWVAREKRKQTNYCCLSSLVTELKITSNGKRKPTERKETEMSRPLG
ncbi:hypothetical protein CEXT_568721 [Caerostris extrusa]|uniref:Uncharacterized protein n=1 Tax=Caerostris extrusa TaxID=172846 RepID=A0AAV4QZK7_CAEEX|nr:hypothetical protein CEXT_568721 [Caerostris extrusa]